MIDITTDPLISVVDAAELLSVHPNTVKGWIKAGKLEAIKVGGVWKTTVAALQRFIQPATPKPPTEADIARMADQRRKTEERSFVRRMGLG